MLEFQEGFFEREIRDDFYVDTTMKTVWAAEMEVLQRVAEICDRHGITWYAAYGTLLGAIRHEGFVPWDDDLDIWVKRSDYNRLIKLLLEELPKNYNVRSSLLEVGYDEYPTCVSNGKQISINREWLEMYHGCPFSVGMDIFPLDYLPREEDERVEQERLFSAVMRCAQSARALGRNEVSDPEKRQFAAEKIGEGILYLEENFAAKINHRLLEEGKWEEVASELWKWANYFAMMYEKEESDYLVNYADYMQWPGKKFPKEWFAEVYSATFENFMLPVPCGYDQILRCIYGDYHVCIRGTTKHDYPFYEKQLEELQELIRRNAEITGTNVEKGIDPANWQELLVCNDGARKKIVLFVNDITDFIMYRDEALDKLESTLQVFHEAREKILLWWRPQAEMFHALALVDQSAVLTRADSAEYSFDLGLAERYSAILEQYKIARWGICDESNDKLRAMEICDAYYGAENRLVKKLQDSGKPIMIASGR